MTTLVEMIAKKRDGLTHNVGEIQRLISSFRHGEFADYQMSAWLMAAYLRGLDERETLELCDAMLHSGTVLDLSDIPGIKVDKHSTGGVGDKISIALAPWVASCGVPVPMVSGRGLGHTGGTLDKLESIPGFNVNLSIDEFRTTIRTIGTCMIGQTQEIAPIDKRIYALRDVTATVESIPLITASILSKKLAEGIDALVLDVKVGRGAFMKHIDQARKLAQSLVRVASRAGKKVTAFLTDMDHPLGRSIGNALETAEAIEIIHGRGPHDSFQLTLELATEMLILGGVASNIEHGKSLALESIHSGRAAETMRRMIQVHRGDARVVDEPCRLPKAPIIKIIAAKQAGYITDINPLELGLAAIELGAGRTRADQNVDPSVGFVLKAVQGDRVEIGSPLIEVHASSELAFQHVYERVYAAFSLHEQPRLRNSLIFETIRD